MEARCHRHTEARAQARCVECGRYLCGRCRTRVDGRNRCRGCVPGPLRHRLPRRRSPALAALLSVVPGIGQMYAGRVARGLALFLTLPFALALLPDPPHPLTIFLWIFNLVDAHQAAYERNVRLGLADPDPVLGSERRLFLGVGLLAAGFHAARAAGFSSLDPLYLWPATLLLLLSAPLFARRNVDVAHA